MPYRNERQALEDRRDELTHRLAYIANEAQRTAALQTEVDALRRDLAVVTARLADHEQRRALPVLDDLRIASPCGVAWESMVGDERTRHCSVCNKNVFNLSALTRDAAEALVTQAEGDLCVRMYKRADGTVITADCQVGARKRRRRLALIAVGASAVAAAATGAWAAFARDPTVEPTSTTRPHGAAEVLQGLPAVPHEASGQTPAPVEPREVGPVIQGGIGAPPHVVHGHDRLPPRTR